MTYFFVQNSRGDVIKLLNENGDIIRDYEYEPFGKEQDVKTDGYGADYFSAKWKQEVEDNAIDNPFRFGEEYKDEESGNYYLRARYYDPEIQRFTQEDTYSGTYDDPMSQNGYAFCGNNPINYIDPTGHWQESDKKYDSATQQKIIKATNDYYAAKTPEGREAAHDAANAARKAGDKNGNGSLGKTVNTYYNTQTGNKGYVTGSEWESTLTSATKLLTGLSGGSQVNMTGEKRDNSREHAIMDVAGLVPVIGEPCDLINTISYLTEGDYKNAGLSAASMIPIVSSLKGLKYANEAADLIKVKRAGKVGKGFNTFNDAKKFLGSPGEGKQWHHIVEQSQINKSGFSSTQIQNTNNLIAVDKATHAKISGYYNSIDVGLSDSMRVRDWLAGQSFEIQYQFGMDVLKRFEVTK